MRCLSSTVPRTLAILAIGLSLAALEGCTGGSSRGPTAPVKGKVTYKGQPLPDGCTVVFVHKEKSFPVSAPIKADGSYTLLFNGKPGIPCGTYNVSVTPPAGSEATVAPPSPSDPEAYKAAMLAKPKTGKDAGAKKVSIPAKFQKSETSGQTFTVMEGQDSYDWDIRD